ncbi:flagellar basal body-associated FliL family protein [Desulfoscipio gibsoniae]|uniref:Flagellar protein FliL n=1 Tax=Desulfoscipio gibsoniae DSM 7213 TaxID=767817 RepID=R4KGC7_9FIRM|nr:flagellar basal body-associated FliL family protein [Desulfoscipio gibsoniae]AGL01649.1 flagellar basal body-associated protein [Desulfoscipio gibsoniae DSM 7213]
MALVKPDKDKKNKSFAEKTGLISLKIMLAMMLVVLLVGIGVIIGYFKFFESGGNQNFLSKEKQAENITLTSTDLGDMVVNLSGPDNHYLKTKITIEYPKEKEFEKLVSEGKSHIIEATLLTLRNKTLAEVSPPNASENLKEELIININNRFDEKVIKNVIFTQYIVQ